MPVTYTWVRVSKREPCKVCGKPDFCTFAPDAGLAHCQRVESARPSRNTLGGYLHPLNGTSKSSYTPSRPAATRPYVNWQWYMEKWGKATKPEWIAGLATNLGVSVESLVAIGCVWAQEHRAFAFPMHGGDGKVCGVRLRDHKTGRKWAVLHSQSGIFLSDHVPQRRLYVLEGPTDTAAALSLRLYAVGRPSCSGGVLEINQTIRRLGIREVCIISDNDDKRRPDGSAWNPGLEGADVLADSLLVPSVTLVLPCKDTRELLRNGGTADTINFLVQNQVWKQPKNSSCNGVLHVAPLARNK